VPWGGGFEEASAPGALILEQQSTTVVALEQLVILSDHPEPRSIEFTGRTFPYSPGGLSGWSAAHWQRE